MMGYSLGGLYETVNFAQHAIFVMEAIILICEIFFFLIEQKSM